MFAVYRTLLKTCFAQQLQYRAALMIWLLGFILEPTVYMVVWSTIAKSRGGHVGSFEPADIALYYLIAMLINHLTFDWHFFEMETRVRNGSFSPLLLRPIHPIHADLADNLCYKMLTFPVMFAAAAILYWYFGATLRPPLWSALLFIPALALAFAMRFLLEWTLALTGFWTTRMQAIITTYIIFQIFLSGRFTPLELLPPTIQHVARMLPFRLWASFPIELLMGRMTPDDAYKNLAQQILWIAAFFVLFKVVWHRGMKRYSAVGA